MSWREGAGGPADNNVLRRAAFQPHRVDEDVKGDRPGQQRSRNPIHRQSHDDDGCGSEDAAEAERVAWCHAAGGQRPLPCALHDGVDVAVVPHVDRPRGAGADGDAQHRDSRQEGVKMTRREVETDEAGEDDERHDARLQQRDVVANAGLQSPRADAGNIGVQEVDGGEVGQGLRPACGAGLSNHRQLFVSMEGRRRGLVPF